LGGSPGTGGRRETGRERRRKTGRERRRGGALVRVGVTIVGTAGEIFIEFFYLITWQFFV